MSQDQDIFYDVDRDIIGPHRTPPLEAVKPNYESQDSPPPLVRLDLSSDSTDVEDTDGVRSTRKPKRRKGGTHRTFADGVLIRSIDPNLPDVASHAERNPLESASQSEAEEQDNEAGAEAGQEHMRRSREAVLTQATQARTKPKEIAKAALNVISANPDKDDWPMVDTPVSVDEEKLSRSPPSAANGIHKSNHREQIQAPVHSQREDLSKKRLNTLPPPLNGGLRLNLKPNHEYDEDDEDSIIKSPALGKFAITPRDAHPDVILPAMQQISPPRSSPAGSPDHKQTLPNLKTAIGNIHDSSLVGFASMSPIMGRPSPGHLTSYASPASYSTMSPPGPPSQYNWRTTIRDSHTSTSSDYTSSSATTSTSASSIVMVSPAASSIVMVSPAASNPSSSTALLEQEKDRTQQESLRETGAESQPDSQSEQAPVDASASARFASGAYKCTYHGCAAAPFQTQYLLNSHMNVHSNARTHFCPVKGCPRGPGGQGFKRKNEMIRHGLVHTSPGYICPYCPDQQHKYPRPDNLQRHVRQHHTDKDRDDPILRDVLNQRMEGGSRGGRRRMRL